MLTVYCNQTDYEQCDLDVMNHVSGLSEDDMENDGDLLRLSPPSCLI